MRRVTSAKRYIVKKRQRVTSRRSSSLPVSYKSGQPGSSGQPGQQSSGVRDNEGSFGEK